jgi:hypothetical protein
MKKISFVLLSLTILLLVQCHSKKKAQPVASASTTPASGPLVTSSDGIYPPGENELTALQGKYPTVKMETLSEGHQIYTKGACINCHGPKNIYRHDAIAWARIMEDMAYRARLTPSQKDAVHMYVLSIKAAQNTGK